MMKKGKYQNVQSTPLDSSFENKKNTLIINVTVDYIISNGRLDKPVFKCS